jgi:hypothetical protein
MTIDILNEAKLIENTAPSESSWDELLEEHEGCFTESGEIFFKIGQDTLDMDFEICVTGHCEYDPGDYWTAPYSETVIEDIDIQIETVFLNGDEIQVSDEFKSELVKLIEKSF